MFRNFILPAAVVALIAIVVRNPAFAHDTMHKKILAIAVIVGPAALIWIAATARKPRKKTATARPAATPYGR